MTAKDAAPENPMLDGAKKLFIQEVIAQSAVLASYANRPSLTDDEVESVRKLLHKVKGGVGFFALANLASITDEFLEHCKLYPSLKETKRPSWIKKFDSYVQQFETSVAELR